MTTEARTPRFAKARALAADDALIAELKPLGNLANEHGWYGPHGIEDLPGKMEDLHNRRNVLDVAFDRLQLLGHYKSDRICYFFGTESVTTFGWNLDDAPEGTKVILRVDRDENGYPLWTEVK